MKHQKIELGAKGIKYQKDFLVSIFKELQKKEDKLWERHGNATLDTSVTLTYHKDFLRNNPDYNKDPIFIENVKCCFSIGSGVTFTPVMDSKLLLRFLNEYDEIRTTANIEKIHEVWISFDKTSVELTLIYDAIVPTFAGTKISRGTAGHTILKFKKKVRD